MDTEHIEGGCILLARKSLGSQVFQDDQLWKVWCWCLMKANHKENWAVIKTGRGDTQVRVDRGQFIFGRKSAAKELKQKPSSVYFRMKKLRNMRNLDMQTNTHFSIITICNYERYQNLDLYSCQAGKQPTDNQLTTNRQPTDTNKNDKNDKNVKNKIIFENFRLFYPGRKRALDTEFAYFCKCHRDWREVLPKLLPAAQAQIRHAVQQKAAEKFVPEWKDLKSWIYNRYWETIPETKTKRKDKCCVCGSEQTTGSFDTTSGPRRHCANDDCKKKIQGW